MATLEELYSRDPNKWTREDVETIVADLRKQRSNFMAKEQAEKAESKAKSTPKPAVGKLAKPPAKALGQLSLESLGISVTIKPPPTSAPSETPTIENLGLDLSETPNDK